MVSSGGSFSDTLIRKEDDSSISICAEAEGD